MNDAGLWTVAVMLAGAGVAAEGYLAWTFIRDWRIGRAEERARRLKWRGSRTTTGNQSESAATPNQRALVGLATLGLAAGTAWAHVPAAPSDPVVQLDQPAEPEGSPIETALVEPPPGTAPIADGSIGSAISVQLNVDFTNAYFYRGIRQQDKGLMVQPAARLTARLVDDTDFKLDAFIGTWNSFGPNAGTQTGGLIEDWYESDLYAGVALSYGNLTLTTSYTFLTSPSDAFQEVEELGFTVALDDSEWLNEWSLKPYATLAVETGSNGSDGPDFDNGTYLELGIAPGFSFDVGDTPVTLAFPASVGLSLSDYYQDAGGNDDTFGFAQVGAKASIPLGEPGRLGGWTLNAGVSVLFLGDHTKAFNDGEDTEVIGSVGLQWNF